MDLNELAHSRGFFLYCVSIIVECNSITNIMKNQVLYSSPETQVLSVDLLMSLLQVSGGGQTDPLNPGVED